MVILKKPNRRTEKFGACNKLRHYCKSRISPMTYKTINTNDTKYSFLVLPGTTTSSILVNIECCGGRVCSEVSTAYD